MDAGTAPRSEAPEELAQQLLNHRAGAAGGDWACINLSRQNLDGIDLSGAYLEQVDLSGASLVGANLCGAILARANLEGANLTGANLEGATLRGAKLERFYRRPFRALTRMPSSAASPSITTTSRRC